MPSLLILMVYQCQKMKSYSYLCLLSLLLFYRSCWSIEESNCQNYLPLTEVFDFFLLMHVSEVVPDAYPLILEVNYTCLAQGTFEGTYRALSVIITYYPNTYMYNSTEINAAHFQLLCYDFQWVLPFTDTIDNITGSVTPLDTRFDCSSCRSGLNQHHCIRKSTCAQPNLFLLLQMITQ